MPDMRVIIKMCLKGSDDVIRVAVMTSQRGIPVLDCMLMTWTVLVMTSHMTSHMTSAEVFRVFHRDQIRRAARHVMSCGSIPGLG